MTWRQTTWTGWQRWLFLGVTAMFIAIWTVILLDDSATNSERIISSLILVASWIFMAVMHSWLHITTDRVRMGFFPLYRATLPFREIRDISVVTFNPLRDFGGTGLKGSARSKNGILLGGVPNTGLRFETFDNRRYVITLHDLEPAIQALETQGFTLSAESTTDSQD
ncbi:MAG: hypothetical protein M9953_03315 [Thermomicrobiales bacterium]|nr:hypothetical protein [Thermomicrobiales bacterium]MCO5224347.1 hypothetical protein [Thermomicrobiales bacterium]MCO5228285.1 hypothetical protein [Thermomicrobiales bacterium]